MGVDGVVSLTLRGDSCQTVTAFSSFASNRDAACRRRAEGHIDLVHLDSDNLVASATCAAS
jgi:hypothetical protein